MDTRKALLRGAGAHADTGVPDEDLVADVVAVLEVLIPETDHRARAIRRLKQIDTLTGHGRSTVKAREVASVLAVHTLNADLSISLGDAGGIRLTNGGNQVADVRADGSIYLSGLSMTLDEVARRWEVQAVPA